MRNRPLLLVLLFLAACSTLAKKPATESVKKETPAAPETKKITLFEAISSDAFGFCLDVGHHNVFADEPLEKWIDAFGEKIMEVHLHDNDGKEDSHWAIGTGNVDFSGLFQRIRTKGLQPTITLEPHEEETLWQSLGAAALKSHFETSPGQV